MRQLIQWQPPSSASRVEVAGSLQDFESEKSERSDFRHWGKEKRSAPKQSDQPLSWQLGQSVLPSPLRGYRTHGCGRSLLHSQRQNVFPTNPLNVWSRHRKGGDDEAACHIQMWGSEKDMVIAYQMASCCWLLKHFYMYVCFACR